MRAVPMEAANKSFTSTYSVEVLIVPHSDSGALEHTTLGTLPPIATGRITFRNWFVEPPGP